ncbi:MAG TPA: VWA domain-containing protein [Pyrinomonadaceae bacterium]|nr:VWA domain-containing protein [Pyrinomonadaceae bacterium]
MVKSEISIQVANPVKYRIIGFISILAVLLYGLAVSASQDPNLPPPGSTQNTGPQSTATPTATPTPSPTLKPTSSGRIAPTLGEPPPPPKLRPTPTPEPPEEIEPDSVVKVNTELVTLNVRVIDRNNRPIDNVPQSEFQVFEDGEPQPIEFFAKQEVPIIYGLAIDTSGSLRSQIQSVIDASRIIITSNKPGDETFIERFISSDKIEIVQDFTADRNLALDGLDSLYVEGGQTAVVDGVYLAAEHVAKYKKGDDNDRRRRALIVITDGEDRNSFYKEEQLLARLQEEDVQIYVIGFVNELEKEAGFIRKSPRQKALNLLNKLASETGGRAFYPHSLSELPQIASEIVRDLRTQYVLAYNPTNKARDGSYRAIKVNVSETASPEKRIALTRRGRLAPKGELSPATPSQRSPAEPAKPANKTPTNELP